MTDGVAPAVTGDTSRPIVCNASPLIALAQINRLDVLRQLFVTVLASPAVCAEVAPTVPSLPAWIIPTPLAQPVPSEVLAAALGLGETEAIALALERKARVLVLDDRAARRMVHSLGVAIVGTLGILLAAKRRGVLTALRPCLDDLDAFHFRVSEPLREQVLRDAGEAP